MYVYKDICSDSDDWKRSAELFNSVFIAKFKQVVVDLFFSGQLSPIYFTQL